MYVLVLLTKGAGELRLIVVKQTLLDEEQRRCKGSYSQKGAATDIKVTGYSYAPTLMNIISIQYQQCKMAAIDELHFCRQNLRRVLTC